MTIDQIQSELTRLVAELEAAGDDYAAGLVAQAKLDLRRAQALVEPGEREAA